MSGDTATNNTVTVPTDGHTPGGTNYLNCSYGIRSWLLTLDHKRIGVMYLVAILTSFFLGGIFALLVRTELLTPGQTIVDADTYNRMFTLHGAIMIFLFIIPGIPAALGNFILPLQLGAKDVALPRLNLASVHLYLGGAIFLLAAIWLGGVDTGWTFYTPYSTTTNGSVVLVTLGVFILGFSSIFTGLNFIVTIHRMRPAGMGWFGMPLFLWALYATAIIQVLATPVLGITVLLLIAERMLGIGIFDPALGGDPVLFQHFFWFYSHPAVYIMILPAMGFVSDVLSTFARKPLFGYRPMVYSISAIAGLGFVVWGHHMFVSGMNPYLGSAFMVSTMMIALPSAVKVFNWIGTLWGGQIRFTASMCFAIAFVSMFIIGGLSGIFMAATPVDIQIHDTYFIVGHIHYVLFTGSLFGIFAGIYYWYPKMFGRLMNERLGRWHFGLTFIFGNGTFFLMHIVGLGGMQRRIADPLQYEHLHGWIDVSNQIMTVSAFILFLAQILFFVNFFRSLTTGEKAGRNPWQANSLEWETASPPPHGNFGETIPTVFRGPYEYASPDSVDEDYLPQSRDLERDRKTS